MQVSEAEAEYKKAAVSSEACRFHGHVLSAAGLSADPEKVRVVLDMPNPTDAEGVQRCVGFVNYLSRFMPHLSEVCEPLRRLLDKEVPWHWLPKHEAAMKEIKTLVRVVPLLRYYDVSKSSYRATPVRWVWAAACFKEDSRLHLPPAR